MSKEVHMDVSSTLNDELEKSDPLPTNPEPVDKVNQPDWKAGP